MLFDVCIYVLCVYFCVCSQCLVCFGGHILDILDISHSRATHCERPSRNALIQLKLFELHHADEA